MVFKRASFPMDSGGGGFGIGSGRPLPRDILVLMVVLFVTYSMGAFAATSIIPAMLQLSPFLYAGCLWQLVTNPFAGTGRPSVWIILELLMIYWFGRDVFWMLGRRRFWSLLMTTAVGAGVVAGALGFLLIQLGYPFRPGAMFIIMQGQYFVLTFLFAAFANLAGDATLMVWFVLPLKARWLLWLTVLFAFIGLLTTGDLAGFFGSCATIGIVTAMLTPGGPRELWRRWRLQLRQLMIKLRLARLRSRRRFDVFDGDDRGRGGGSGPDRWVH